MTSSVRQYEIPCEKGTTPRKEIGVEDSLASLFSIFEPYFQRSFRQPQLGYFLILQEVVEEDRKAKLPKNFEEKQYWAQHALDEEKKAAQAKSEGRDYNVSTGLPNRS